MNRSLGGAAFFAVVGLLLYAAGLGLDFAGVAFLGGG